MHRAWLLAGAIAVLVPLSGPTSSGPAATGCRTVAVTRQRVSFPHVRSLREAVGDVHPCDWIVVAPGVYAGGITIRTPDLHLRGLERNGVVIDGAHRAVNGITVEASGVSIENLTVRNFDRRSRNDDETGNEVRWLGTRNWVGRYLTVYDTGLRGGYGIWAARSSNGVLDNVYASGFSDSGFYVGACRDCQAVVEHAAAERNLIGLAATNASGRFLVEASVFRDNSVGLSLNSSLSDPPPPQFGSCAAGRNRALDPTVRDTGIDRCTILRDNRILANDNANVPSETASVRPGDGIGIELLGASGDAVEQNVIAGNSNIGILGLPLPFEGPTRFELAGDRIVANQISGSQLAIALGGRERSVGNCVQLGSSAATLPDDLRPFSCRHRHTPALPARSTRALLALIAHLHRQAQARTPRPQPTPARQPTMPDPCRGAPPTPLCRVP